MNGYTEQVTLLDFRIVRETSIEFKPYVGTIATVEIPEAIQAHESYGKSYTTLDFESKKILDEGITIEFDGTENWRKSDTAKSGVYRWFLDVPNTPFCYVNDTIVSEIACTAYEAVSAVDTWNAIRGISYKANGIHIFDEGFSANDVNAWKAYLAARKAAGVPIIARCRITTLTEVDFSAELTGYDKYLPIKAESGGSLVFENEHKNAVPSETITVDYAV